MEATPPDERDWDTREEAWLERGRRRAEAALDFGVTLVEGRSSLRSERA